MKIRTRQGHVVDIFAIYWWGDGETYFYGLPRGNGGLSAYKLDTNELEVIDPTVESNFVYFHNNAHGIYHESLIKEKLLDDLLEFDETAYHRFLEILKAEGRVDPDFY